MRFLTSIRNFNGRLKVPYSEAVTTLKQTKTSVNAFDNVWENIKFKEVKGELTANGVRLRELEPDLRSGNLRSFAKKINIPDIFTEADEIAFRKINNNVPEIHLDRLKKKVRDASIVHQDLDILVSSVDDLRRKMQPQTKVKLDSFLNKLKAKAGTGLVVTGTLTAIVFGADIYKSLLNAAHNRNGCHLVQTINGKTTSCKILSKSCNSDDTFKVPQCSTAMLDISNSHLLNPLIYLLHVLRYEPAELQQLISETGRDINDKTVQQLLDNPVTYEIVSKHFLNYKTKISNICTLHATVENLPMPNCVACNPSAPLNSLEYVDTSDLPENFSFVCIKNTTILDVLVDLFGDINVFGTIKSFVSDSMKYATISAVAFAVIAIIVYIFMYFRRRRRNNNNEYDTGNSVRYSRLLDE